MGHSNATSRFSKLALWPVKYAWSLPWCQYKHPAAEISEKISLWLVSTKIHSHLWPLKCEGTRGMNERAKPLRFLSIYYFLLAKPAWRGEDGWRLCRTRWLTVRREFTASEGKHGMKQVIKKLALWKAGRNWKLFCKVKNGREREMKVCAFKIRVFQQSSCYGKAKVFLPHKDWHTGQRIQDLCGH